MKRILVFPDVHGRDFDMILLNAIKEVDKVIFLGDYWDSFDIPLTHQVSVFQNIIDFKRSFPNKITLLLGNHDVQYMPWLTPGNNVNCSGKQDSRMIPMLMEENEELFEFSTIEGNYLFTHAGVSKQWLNSISPKYGRMYLDDINDFINSKPKELFWIGEYNGGLDPCDGPLWARPFNNEFPEEFIQVVGHTFSIYGRIQTHLHVVDRGFPTMYFI